jgi:hypothetical protein
MVEVKTNASKTSEQRCNDFILSPVIAGQFAFVASIYRMPNPN